MQEMPHNIMSVKLRPQLICSKTGGTWVEVVVVFFSFFFIFARHIEWLYSKNRFLTYNHHLCFMKNRTKIKFSSNNYHFCSLINLCIWATTRENVPWDNILGIRKNNFTLNVYCFLSLIPFI